MRLLKNILSSVLILLGLSHCIIGIPVRKSNNDELFPLNIIHINDFHAHFEQSNWDSNTCKEKLGQVCIGGYARTMTAVKRLQKENADKNSIFLNIGDNFQGTLWFELLGWNVTSSILNLLPADATTLGNHEFDNNIEGLVPYMETLKSPIVVANIDDRYEPSFQGKYKKSIIIEKSGRKIGLIGILAVETKEFSLVGNLIISDEVESAKKEADRLKNEEGVDIVVILSHSGYNIDKRMAVEGGSNIDVIVGGHTHTFLFTGENAPGPDKSKGEYPTVVTQSNGHKVLIVQASSYTKYLGNLTVYFDQDGEVQSWEGNPIFLDSRFEEDPDIKEAMKPWKNEVDKFAKREIGVITQDMNVVECAYGECALGNMIADAVTDQYVNDSDSQKDGTWTSVTISLITTRAIRGGLRSGSVTFDDLFTVMPLSMRFDLIDIQGKDLLNAFEYCAKGFGDTYFLQVSGVHLTINYTRPYFNRVESIKVLCNKCTEPRYKPLNLEEWYPIAVQHWLVERDLKIINIDNMRNHRKGLKDTDIVENYLAKHKPYSARIDGRIAVIH